MNEKHRRLKNGTPDDWPSLALLEFTVALARAMKANCEMNQKALADALGVSPPYISSVMSGNENLTVEQMSRLAEATGSSLHITIAPRGLRLRWIEDSTQAATHLVPVKSDQLSTGRLGAQRLQAPTGSFKTPTAQQGRLLATGTQLSPSQHGLVHRELR